MSDVKVERHGSTMLLRLNRADRHNAVGGSMLRELVEAFEDAEADDAVRVLITTGEGTTFCVGADLERLSGGLDLPARDVLNDTSVSGETGSPKLSAHQRVVERFGPGRWTQRMLALEKPTIAAINGAAAGGGLALAALHDFRVVSEDATLAAGFGMIGLGPELGLSYTLPRIVGYQAALAMLLRGTRIDGTKAGEIGFADVVTDTDSVLDVALSIAEQLGAMAPIAMRLTKRLTRASLTSTLDRQLEEEYSTQQILFDQPEARAKLQELVTRIASRREG